MTPSKSAVNKSVVNTKAPPRPAWRTDIEGLRGIAVLLVVLYHAGVPGFAGGYIGVDVFFVLSGYLITGILVKEAESRGSIDLMRFYARRARRLLPASALLLAFVVGFAFLFYAPLEQVDIAKTALATAAYISNIYFGRGATDYLAAEAETNPLLHTWSLSVEEQFYVVWPALVILFLFGFAGLRRKEGAFKRERLVWGTAIIAALSFALTLYLMATGRTHWAFFSSPTRAWEFALGGLGALLPVVGNAQRGLTGLTFGSLNKRIPLLTQILGWLGLLAVLMTGFVYTAATPFPGWAALLPVLGTVFVLRAGAANADTALGKLLAVRPLRELGRLSYSWYLWHWPPLVFATSLYGELLLSHRLIIALVSLGLAELSYRLVENPVRHNTFLSRKNANSLGLLGVLTVVSLALSVTWWQVAEAELRTPEQARYMQARADIPSIRPRGCNATFLETQPAACSDGPPDARFKMALYGDSHAAHWAPTLEKVAKEQGWQVTYFTKSSCAGIDVTAFHRRLGRDYVECDEWRENALEMMAALEPDVIVMSSRAGEKFELADWRSGSERVYERLANAAENVIIVRDPDEPSVNAPNCLSRLAWQESLNLPITLGESNCNDFIHKDINESVFAVQQEAAANFSNVHFLDLSDVFCPEGSCSVELDGEVVFSDAHHLTSSYASSLADEFISAIVDLSARASNQN